LLEVLEFLAVVVVQGTFLVAVQVLVVLELFLAVVAVVVLITLLLQQVGQQEQIAAQ
jgi:hypothetical protein